ncbi:MAG: hypothetical protein CL921_06390, partial [Deltaproteobacteria bacterium]|nr:hypothetical protein [Deltaproteobacteria bacterium]
EQILDSASKDPAPTVTSGEEGTANTIAKFSTSEGLAPQPSDVVLANVNAALPAESQLQGISRLMPVRIPFSAPLANLYDENGNWDARAGSNLAQNLLILNLTDSNAAPILPMPIGGGGSFKVVYQDANHKLVLVPEADTFQAGTMYAVAVKTSLGDAQGNNISPDALTNILTNPSPIVVDGKIVNTLFDDLDTANGLEGLRTSYAPLVEILQALGQIETHNDLAQLFTFTTEAEDPDVAAGTASLLSAVQANLANTSSASSDNVSWAASYPSNSITLGDQPVDLKSAVLNSLANPDTKILKDDVAVAIIPTDNVSVLYKGYFPCQNFLAQTTNGWELDLLNRAATPGTDCPNSDPALNGKIGFWLSVPNSVEGVVVFMPGITDVKEQVFTVMNTLASKNFATIVIDFWGHGDRTYEDVNGNGNLADDSGAAFIRFDNPALSVGYFLQTQFDLFRLRTLLEANPRIFGAIGNTPTVTPVYYFGFSGAGMIGSNLIANNFPAKRFVLNNPGGDLIDILLSGDFGPGIREGVAAASGIDTSTRDGQETLNSTMLGVELAAAHAVFKGGIDPLSSASLSNSDEILIQQILGDLTTPNSNTDLLSLAEGVTTYKDGDGASDNRTRSRWIFNPSNYKSTTENTESVVHRSLVNWKTEATLRAQQQAACFFATGKVLDPSKAINTATCTNIN